MKRILTSLLLASFIMCYNNLENNENVNKKHKYGERTLVLMKWKLESDGSIMAGSHRINK
jgi:hypothetical protein